MTEQSHQPASWSVPLDQYGMAPTAQATGPGGAAVVQGLAVGVAAAAVSAWLWATMVAVTGYQIGFAAVGVALLVGTAVRLGSRGAAGAASRAGSVVLTLIAMVVAEYLIVRQYLNELADLGMLDHIPLLMGPVDALRMVGESLAADPMTLAFWAIAVVSAWRFAASADESSTAASA